MSAHPDTLRPTPALRADTHADLLAALSGASADGERALSLRTRRAVFNAARNRETERAAGQRNLFIAVLATAVVTLLLAPAIWSGLQDILGGGTLIGVPVMLAALGMMLLTGVGASLLLLRDDRRTAHHVRHHRR